jgi:predicted membrane-bound dolichyl-phosphate-mannose-protein mannosyltransferase
MSEMAQKVLYKIGNLALIDTHQFFYTALLDERRLMRRLRSYITS